MAMISPVWNFSVDQSYRSGLRQAFLISGEGKDPPGNRHQSLVSTCNVSAILATQEKSGKGLSNAHQYGLFSIFSQESMAVLRPEMPDNPDKNRKIKKRHKYAYPGRWDR